MKQLPSSDFRTRYVSEREPVEVTSHGKTMGYWYPSGTEPKPGAPESIAEAPAETGPTPQARMSIRPAKGPRPIMVSTEKRVLDPLDLRKRERERYSEFQSRMYGPKKKSAVE